MRIDVYVDGSYSKTEPDVVYGGTVVLQDGEPKFAQRYFCKRDAFTSMNNVGGEVIASMFSLGAVLSLADKCEEQDKYVYVYYDYTGVKEALPKPKGSWRNLTSPGLLFYRKTMDELFKKFPNVHVDFVKVKGHSGNRWNDVVDSIAKGFVPAECEDVMLPQKGT